MSAKRIVASFDVQTEDGRRNLEQLKQSMLDFGDAGTKAAPGITNNLENIERAITGVERKLESGRVVTQRDVGLMAQQFALLEDRIKDAFGSLENAPAALQNALHSMQSRVGETTNRIGQLTDATRDSAAAARLAGDQWPGLGNAIEAVGGKLGTFAAKFAVAVAAIRESYSIFRGMADFAGVDQSGMQAFIASVQKHVQDLNDSMVEATATVGSLQVALNEGDWEGANRNLLELTSAAAQFVGAVSQSREEAAAFNALLQAGVPVMTAATTSFDDLAKVAELWATYQAAGNEGIKAFNDILKQHPDDVAAAIKALKEWETNLGSLKATTNDVTEAEKRRLETVKEAMAFADQVVAKMQAEREARRLGMEDLENDILAMTNYKKALEDAATSADMATRVKGGLSESMRMELEAILELLPAYQDHTAKLDAFGAALERDISLYADGLSPAQEEQLRQIAKLVKSYDEVTSSEREHTKQLIEKELKTTSATESSIKLTGSLEDGTAKLTNAAAEAGKAAVSYDELTRTITQNKTATDDHTGAVDAFGQKLITQELALATYEERLNSLAIRFEAVATSARTAASAIDAVGAAAAGAAGENTAGVYQEIPGSRGGLYPGGSEGF